MKPYLKLCSLLSLLSSGLLSGACSAEASGMTVIVEADRAVAARSHRVLFEVLTQEGTVALSEQFELLRTPFPITRAISPRGGDASRVVTITAQALDVEGNVVTSARMRRAFEAGRRLEVRLRLYELCIGVSCGAEQTCEPIDGRGQCVDVGSSANDAGIDVSPTDTAPVDTAVIDSQLDSSADASTEATVCIPQCLGRTCGVETACGTSCGTCESPAVCGADGVCGVTSPDGPMFIDAPTILQPQPVRAGGYFDISMTVADAQGVDTIALAEVRNPTGASGIAGRYVALTRRAGTGEYNARVYWDVFSAANGGLPEDVSGTTSRTLRLRFVDQTGNELLRDITVQLGGCDDALCGGRCADCANEGRTFQCSATRCAVTECNPGYQVSQIYNCSDINECEQTPNGGCGQNAFCTNVPGSAFCRCNTGYLGDGYQCQLVQRSLFSMPANSNDFGRDVAISGDGTVFMVGNAQAGGGVGTVTSFVRGSGVWGEPVVLNPAVGERGFGRHISLSRDGNTTAISQNGDVVSVFTRSGGVWSPIANPMAPEATDAVTVTALSADGNQLLVANYLELPDYLGIAAFFIRNGSTWSVPTFLPRPAGVDAFAQFAAMSDDSEVVALSDVGSISDDPGRVDVYTQTGGTWARQTTLTPPDNFAGYFGNALAMSSDGTVIAVADGRGGTNYDGTVRVFSRSGTTWDLSSSIERPFGVSRFGTDIALSAQGDLLVVSDDNPVTPRGRVWVYRRSAQTWLNLGPLDFPSSCGALSVAVSADGRTVGIGRVRGTCGEPGGIAAVFDLPPFS